MEARRSHVRKAALISWFPFVVETAEIERPIKAASPGGLTCVTTIARAT